MKTYYLVCLCFMACALAIHGQNVEEWGIEPNVNYHTTSNIELPGFNVQDGLNLGLSGSFPINGAKNVTAVGVLLDANYIYQASRTFGVGLATGYGIYFGKETNNYWGPINNGADFRYIPVALATRYAVSYGIVLGADVGYAIALSNNWDGGFYYRPLLGYNVTERLQVNISYNGISDNWTWSAINLGLTFNIN